MVTSATCVLKVKTLDRTAFRKWQLFAMKTLRKMIEHRISIKYCATLPNSIPNTYISTDAHIPPLDWAWRVV